MVISRRFFGRGSWILNVKVKVLIKLFGLVILLTSTSCFAQGEATSYVGSSSMLIECHFVPYDLCLVKVRMALRRDVGKERRDVLSIDDVIKAYRLRLSGRNLFLEPGEYDGITFVEGRHEISKGRVCPVVLKVGASEARVRNPRGESDLAVCSEALHEDDVLVLLIKSVPFIVENTSVMSGNLEVSLLIDGKEASKSSSELAPTGGCWYDEPLCALKM